MAGHSNWVQFSHHKSAFDPSAAMMHASQEPTDRTHLRLEGYGPGDTAIVVDCLTDNPERTRAEVRAVFLEHGGKLGAQGSVAYLFKAVGWLKFAPGTGKSRLTEQAYQAGAEDVIVGENGAIEVLTDPEDFDRIRGKLAAAGFVPRVATLTERAFASVKLRGEQAESMARLLSALEELDDVRNVYTNAEIPDEVLAQL